MSADHLDPERSLFLRGTTTAPADRIVLQAGPVQLTWEAGGIRWVTIAGREAIRGVYVAVRDRDWGTVEPKIRDLHIAASADGAFAVSFVGECRRDEIAFDWRGDIRGDVDGTVTFTMDGRALSAFERNRIGFCVLHPAALAGRPCVVEHTDGTTEHAVLPVHVSPHQPFLDMRAIEVMIAPGLWIRADMAGDTFEMEDQRNWTDASFKTYCTPLALPYPVRIEAGARIRQKVVLTVIGQPLPQAAVGAADHEPVVRVRVPMTVRGAMPQIGFGVPPEPRMLDRWSIERLGAARPSHLRADVRFADPRWRERLDACLNLAEAAGSSLEAALHFSGNVEDQADVVAHAVLRAARQRVARWLVFDESRRAAAAATVHAARGVLSRAFPNVPLGAGTDHDFADLNRDREGALHADEVCFAVSPQVHAFDDMSIMETPAAQGMVVASARAFAGERPIVVSPVTLRRRRNPDAAVAVGPPAEPPSDHRQASLLCAAFTVASLARLIEAGVASVTFYEAAGPRGLMDPEKHIVYPVYHVFAALASSGRPWEVHAAASDSPDSVAAIALARGRERRLVIANLTDHRQSLAIEGLEGPVSVRRMDAPDAVHARASTVHLPSSGLWSETIGPYAFIQLDWEDTRT